ncbi:hypothetical protein [Bradyrhizobium icense]|uniref:Uncharacterized protein n=1 Tax=Bradyrhizobium icense TaxID=1274631 RepID=A0A1B1U898_9BRAD|nr:hypothetical protein [Bradyrhizobium icense]ANV99003.1 hypothetical protein LMTR13_01155 [Bradyrhizobium icense]
MSVITANMPQPSLKGTRAKSLFVVAILSASLLGLGLAYFAGTRLIPLVGREGTEVSLFSADNRSQDVICSNSNASASPQTIRTNE